MKELKCKLFGLLALVMSSLGIVSAQELGGGKTALSSPFFVEVVLPFLLVFVVIFAILQKTHIFGEGKKQIDALVALIVGLIVISFGHATGVIISLIPFLAVTAIIILVFMILYGMMYKEKGFELHKGIKIGVGIAVAIALIVAVLVATGGLWVLIDLFYSSGRGSEIFTNVIFIAIVIAAIAVVLWGGKKPGSSD
jgi:hypothetical protein